MNFKTLIIAFSVLCFVGCNQHEQTLIHEYNLGKEEYRKGNLAGSKKHFKRAVSIKTDYRDVPLYLAKIAYYQGKYEDVGYQLETMLNDETYAYQANLLKLKNDFVFSKDRVGLSKALENALAKDSSNLEILLMAAKVSEELGQIGHSILLYERTIQESSKIALAHQNLFRIYNQAGIKERAKYHSKKFELWNEKHEYQK